MNTISAYTQIKSIDASRLLMYVRSRMSRDMDHDSSMQKPKSCDNIDDLVFRLGRNL